MPIPLWAGGQRDDLHYNYLLTYAVDPDICEVLQLLRHAHQP